MPVRINYKQLRREAFMWSEGSQPKGWISVSTKDQLIDLEYRLSREDLIEYWNDVYNAVVSIGSILKIHKPLDQLRLLNAFEDPKLSKEDDIEYWKDVFDAANKEKSMSSIRIALSNLTRLGILKKTKSKLAHNLLP